MLRRSTRAWESGYSMVYFVCLFATFLLFKLLLKTVVLLPRIDAVAVAGTGMPEERFLKRAEVDETFAREVSTCGRFADVTLVCFVFFSF